MRPIFIAMTFLFLATSATADVLVEFEPQTNIEFAPARGDRFKLAVNLKKAASMEVNLYTADGDLVRTIKSEGKLAAGAHVVEWDGKDNDGGLVPDEAYVPVLTARSKEGQTEVVDPRTTSGGEILEQLKVQPYPNGDIGYTLPAPARVLIRVGIKGGPMLRSLANWAPRSPGKNVQRWDGFDQDQLSDLRGYSDLSLLVIAFKLPEPSIIAYGNNALNYRTYRLKKGWTESLSGPAEPLLERNGQKISLSYYQPRFKDENPRVSVSPLMELPSAADGVAMISAPTSVRVDIAAEDRWLMQEGLYEVGFFVDNAFISEEEHGYVPFTWQLDPASFQVGRHLLTVNISGLDGKTAVKSLPFEVKKQTIKVSE